ncbi:hypothetical protein [Bacillus massilinigeriensis]|uniref:hypothetical protein n=1 Tax=Bacillus mediterraneensis TaxID=1805474 RepID=UPI0008F8320C|nr:hypothetical protein [Bacillus mediterraneensis]
MRKKFEQEKDIDITELVEAFSLDDEIELDNDIREWLQTPSVQLKDYGYEPDSEREYFAFLNEISDYHLTER